MDYNNLEASEWMNDVNFDWLLLKDSLEIFKMMIKVISYTYITYGDCDLDDLFFPVTRSVRTNQHFDVSPFSP